MARAETAIPVRHPATISGLAPDCRRVLEEQYLLIQAAMAPGKRTRAAETTLADGSTAYTQVVEDRPASVAAAIAEYRRVAEMWGVNVEARR